MWLYYGAIGLVVVSNVFYHLSQKSTPANINPFMALLVTYLTAAGCAGVLMPLYPGRETLVSSFKRLNWASVALGFSIVGLEMGFMLAYRAGWNISLAQIFSTVLVTLALIPIGLLVFQDHVSPLNLVGVALCILGVLLIGRR